MVGCSPQSPRHSFLPISPANRSLHLGAHQPGAVSTCFILAVILLARSSPLTSGLVVILSLSGIDLSPSPGPFPSVKNHAELNLISRKSKDKTHTSQTLRSLFLSISLLLLSGIRPSALRAFQSLYLAPWPAPRTVSSSALFPDALTQLLCFTYCHTLATPRTAPPAPSPRPLQTSRGGCLLAFSVCMPESGFAMTCPERLPLPATPNSSSLRPPHLHCGPEAQARDPGLVPGSPSPSQPTSSA